MWEDSVSRLLQMASLKLQNALVSKYQFRKRLNKGEMLRQTEARSAWIVTRSVSGWVRIIMLRHGTTVPSVSKLLESAKEEMQATVSGDLKESKHINVGKWTGSYIALFYFALSTQTRLIYSFIQALFLLLRALDLTHMHSYSKCCIREDLGDQYLARG